MCGPAKMTCRMGHFLEWRTEDCEGKKRDQPCTKVWGKDKASAYAEDAPCKTCDKHVESKVPGNNQDPGSGSGGAGPSQPAGGSGRTNQSGYQSSGQGKGKTKKSAGRSSGPKCVVTSAGAASVELKETRGSEEATDMNSMLGSKDIMCAHCGEILTASDGTLGQFEQSEPGGGLKVAKPIDRKDSVAAKADRETWASYTDRP